MQRKIAAIIAADVAGYSRLVALDEDDTLKRLLAFREIFAECIEKAGGRIFNTAGDAVLAECPSAVEALRAAIDIQEGVRTGNLGLIEQRQMLFRIGITIGDVLERDGDLLGDGVNVAARLESLAEPGGICISRNMFEQVGNKVDVRFRDIGPQVVKNLPTPIHAFVLTAADPSPSMPAVAPRRSLGLRLGSAALALLLVAGGTIAFDRWHAARSANERIFGYAAEPAVTSAPGDTPFDPDRIPFVCAGCRAEIAAAVSEGANSAVALSDTGAYGYSAKLPMVDGAREAAMRACTNHRRGDGVCQTYEINGVVVWPRALPMPPHPWVDPSIELDPFDVSKIGRNASEQAGSSFGRTYTFSGNHKAVALDSEGHWFYRSRLDSEQEAEETVLELCANRTGSICRVVAVDDSFVVAPSKGPVAAPTH